MYTLFGECINDLTHVRIVMNKYTNVYVCMYVYMYVYP